LLLWLLSLCCLPLHAAWYQVEIIVFENLTPDADGEVWLDNPGLPERSNSIDLVTGAAEAAAVGAETGLVPFQALGPSWFRLDGVFRTLRSTREYRPLLHVAWQQPGEGPAADRAVHLEQFREPAAGATAAEGGSYTVPEAILDGTVQLRVGRFLHVAVDMAYFPRAERPTGAAAPAAAPADYMRMRGRRKVLLNDLNYFDHPLFGVLVQVSRLQAPEPEKQADGGPQTGIRDSEGRR
jgi:hypothetical protein